MSGVSPATLPVSFQDRIVNRFCLCLHPAQQSGPEIEADFAVVINYSYDLSFRVEDSGYGISGITFRRYPGIPVVEGGRRVLKFDSL